MDVDLGLEVAMLDTGRYHTLAERLRGCDFEPDKNEEGNLTRQRWTHKKFKGTVSLTRADTQSVTAKISSRVPEDELGLLRSFLGFIDRYCGDQVATITIRYH